MTELTLDDVYNYLKSGSKFTSANACTLAKTNIVGDKSYTITEVDTFLLAQVENSSKYNTSSITKDNFLELYNEQYSRNLEAFVGILIVSAILAKMMIFPTKV
jgi:hypothetical protein